MRVRTLDVSQAKESALALLWLVSTAAERSQDFAYVFPLLHVVVVEFRECLEPTQLSARHKIVMHVEAVEQDRHFRRQFVDKLVQPPHPANGSRIHIVSVTADNSGRDFLQLDHEHLDSAQLTLAAV